MTNEYQGYALVKTASGRMGWAALADLAPVAPLG
jgi:hypothetical protein